MSKAPNHPTVRLSTSPSTEAGGIRTPLLATVCFALGVGAASLWFQRPVTPVVGVAGSPANSAAEVTGQPVPEPVPAVDAPSVGPKPDWRKRVVPASTEPTPADVIAEVRRLVPNLETVSLEEAKKQLRVAAITDFASATEEMEKQVRAAEERLAKARNGGSESEQQAAVKQLQQAQAGQAEKLQTIAARSKAQLDALELIKAGH